MILIVWIISNWTQIVHIGFELVQIFSEINIKFTISGEGVKLECGCFILLIWSVICRPCGFANRTKVAWYFHFYWCLLTRKRSHEIHATFETMTLPLRVQLSCGLGIHERWPVEKRDEHRKCDFKVRKVRRPDSEWNQRPSHVGRHKPRLFHHDAQGRRYLGASTQGTGCLNSNQVGHWCVT